MYDRTQSESVAFEQHLKQIKSYWLVYSPTSTRMIFPCSKPRFVGASFFCGLRDVGIYRRLWGDGRNRELSVYVGQVRLGRIMVEGDDDFIAIDADGNKLGIFASQAAAAFALGTSAEKQRRRSNDRG